MFPYDTLNPGGLVLQGSEHNTTFKSYTDSDVTTLIGVLNSYCSVCIFLPRRTHKHHVSVCAHHTYMINIGVVVKAERDTLLNRFIPVSMSAREEDLKIELNYCSTAAK